MPQKKKSTKVSRAKHPQPQFDFESDGWTDRYKNTIDEKTAKAISELVTDVGLKQVESAIATYRQQQDWETKQPRDSEVRAMLLYCKKVIEPMRELLLHPNNQKRKSLDEITKDHIANKISETYPDDSWGDTEKRLKKDLQKLWESCELLLEHEFQTLPAAAPKKYADLEFVRRLGEIYKTNNSGALSDKPSSRFFRLAKSCFKAAGDERTDKAYSSIIRNWLALRAKSENKSRKKAGLIQS